MSAAQMGQLATIVVALILVGAWLYHLGFFRGFRRAKESDAATVNLLARMDAPPMTVVRGSYRAKKTPIGFPVPVDPHHEDGV